jgi:hypothetical protein
MSKAKTNGIFTRNSGSLLPVSKMPVSDLSRTCHLISLVILLLTSCFCTLGAQTWGDWDGSTISIFDTHKTDQRQVYPDEAEWLKHLIVLGPIGPTVDGVVIIDEEEITEVMLKWNQMHNQKDLSLARSIYAEQVNYYDNRLSKSALITALQRRFNERHPDYSQDITEISGIRAGDTTVQIDLMRDHMAENYMRNPIRMILERNPGGWQIISENFRPFDISEDSQATDTTSVTEISQELAPVDTLLTDLVIRGYEPEPPAPADGLYGAELLLDGSFDDDTHFWKIVNFTAGASTQIVREGHNSYIRLSHQNDRDWCAIGQEIRSKLRAGKTYRISMRYKTDCENPRVPLIVRFGDQDLLMHSSTIARRLDGYFVTNNGLDQWQELIDYFLVQNDLPNSSEPMLDIFFNYGSSGSIYLDDISLKECLE